MKHLTFRIILFLCTMGIFVNSGVVYAANVELDATEQNTAPTIILGEPQQNMVVNQGDVVTIAWEDEDPDDNALISIAYDVDEDPINNENYSWIVQDLAEDPDAEGDRYEWDTAEVPAGDYYIWAAIADSTHEAVYAVAAGIVTIQEEPSQEPTQVPTEVPTQAPTQVPTQPEEEKNDYFQVKSVVLDNGTIIEKAIINGPSEAPLGYERAVVELPTDSDGSIQKTQQLTALTVPAFSWSFGCSATSAAMIAGYYDRNGYSNMYAGPTNGGVMPLDNSSWPDWVDSAGAPRHQCPLSATHKGLDGRTTRGHVDDYWISYGSTATDPWVAYGSEHTYGDCTGDYMKTNQSEHGYNNSDGATSFYYYPTGEVLTCDAIESFAILNDGTAGFRDFFESRGYTVTDCYMQVTSNQASSGFTFAQYKAEIDAGHPVMIHVQGHTMVGVGYYNTDNTVILHDTWDYSNHTMSWGGSYSGMVMWGVSIVHLEAPSTSSTKYDFDGNGTADLSIFRPSNSLWAVKDQIYQTFGKSGDIPVPADYNGDGKTDIAIFRPSTGLWAIKGQPYVSFGKNGDIPVPADYNGDGAAEIAIFRPSTSLWAVKGGAYQGFGKSGDIPVPADYNGDGKTDIAIFRPSTGLWAIKGGSYQGYGKNGDTPLPKTSLYYYSVDSY